MERADSASRQPKALTEGGHQIIFAALKRKKQIAMDDAPGWVDIETLTPLFKGRTRVVYAMQDHPGLLLKLESPERARKIENRTGWLYALKRRSVRARLSYIEREYDTYIRAMIVGAELGRVPPLPHPRGLVLTEAGLGAIVTKVRDKAGNPAPTLRKALEANGGQTTS